MGFNRLFERLKLLKTFDVELIVDKNSFVNELNKRTEIGLYYPIFIIFDIFINKNKEYVGQIRDNRMVLRKRYKPGFLKLTDISIVRADFYMEKGKLNIKTVVKGMGTFAFIVRGLVFIIYFLLMLVGLLELFLMALSSDRQYIDNDMLMGPIIISIIAFIFIGLPYLMAKQSVKNMKDEMMRMYKYIEKTPYNTV